MQRAVFDQIRADIYFSAAQKILKLDPDCTRIGRRGDRKGTTIIRGEIAMIKVTRKEEDIKCDECGETYLATFEVTLADITIHLCIMCIMEFFGHFKPHVGV